LNQRLKADQTIDAGLVSGGIPFTQSAILASGGQNPEGDFLDARGYLPVRLTAAGVENYNYGWIEYEVNVDASTATLYGWAWETTPHTAIFTGQTTAVPEPAETVLGLGLLALGAAGVKRWRQRRATGSQNS
jgi:MYXO-CTERM domain-containing protein